VELRREGVTGLDTIRGRVWPGEKGEVVGAVERERGMGQARKGAGAVLPIKSVGPRP